MEDGAMLQLMDDVLGGTSEAAALPLPEVVDTPAVVLAGLLAGGARPLVLDASAVREVQAAAVPLLASFLRAKHDARAEARIVGASRALRARLADTELAPWLDEASAGVEAFLVCPDRDELGFSPSLR
jgi:ABC-type transporter Mla MlaB component